MTLHHDRWIEMDAIWFNPDQDLDSQIDLALTRLAPLWKSTDGIHGLCFNVGWLIDLVTEWTGNAEQKLPLRSDRTAAWAARTYTDLRDLFARIRAKAAQLGLADLHVGILFVGWAHVVWPPDLRIYGFASDWYDRHPELYGEPKTIIGMPDLWPIKRLKADAYPYATRPGGLAEGTYFPEFFAAQWASLAAFLGVDTLHLRDGMTGPMVYTRNGPYGLSAPADPAIWQEWTQTVIDLYRAIKTASPSTFLIGYSSGISPTAEWRVGCVDLEALVADGAIDAWVDQTWGGAWQDWWGQLWKGWTFQLANLLAHRVQIEAGNAKRATPCRHYNLTETWDGWEPWDTIHQVPGKLRWGIWAYNHAAAITPNGPRTTDGSYISWANHRSGQLLSEEDVKFLSTHLDAAQESASKLEHVYGPLMVYNRPMLDWLMHNHPDWNASEWIEDQIGLLMKWGVPCLGATRIEWLPDVIDKADGLIVQVPGQLDLAIRDVLLKTEKPTLLIGRADLIDPALLERAGAKIAGKLREPGYYHLSAVPEIVHLPEFQPIGAIGDDSREDSEASKGAQPNIWDYHTLQTEEVGPLRTWAHLSYWQPPDWAEPSNAQLPKYQLGSTRLLEITAQGVVAALPKGLSHSDKPDRWECPIACHLWRRAGQLHILLGNLETAVFGDSRTVRQDWIDAGDRIDAGLDHYVLRNVSEPDAPVVSLQISTRKYWPSTFEIVLRPESSTVYKLEIT